jgi:two-component system chemotaxis response regulator CheB
MHVGSVSSLAPILDRCANVPALEARDGEKWRKGHIYVAPPNNHLVLRDGAMALTREPRENGHRPAVDVLFRSAARYHRERVIGVVLSGGRDDGSAGLFAIKSRGGLAIVQDPTEATVGEMPRNAMQYVDVDECLPISEMARCLTKLVKGSAKGGRRKTTRNGTRGGAANGANGGTKMIAKKANSKEAEFFPLACPECNGPLYESKEGELVRFQCKIGHAFGPNALTEAHTEALERALWTAVRALNERITMHRKLLERPARNKAENDMLKRFAETAATAEKDVLLLREIVERL